LPKLRSAQQHQRNLWRLLETKRSQRKLDLRHFSANSLSS
jgi:hypothetical protein